MTHYALNLADTGQTPINGSVRVSGGDRLPTELLAFLENNDASAPYAPDYRHEMMTRAVLSANRHGHVEVDYRASNGIFYFIRTHEDDACDCEE